MTKENAMKIDPMGNFEKAWDVWRKMTDDSIARMTAFYAEIDKVEAKNLERAEQAMHEAAKLTKDTLAYGAQLGAEWRKLSLEALNKATENTAAAATAAKSVS
jgi:hypothetical protein